MRGTNGLRITTVFFLSLQRLAKEDTQADMEPLADSPSHAEHPPAASGEGGDASAASIQIRATEEYAAAFDLEVWKADQKQRFGVSLAAELDRRQKSLELQFAQRDVDRLEEVDKLRRELEVMAKRLNTAGKVLAKRISNQESREEAFETRRLQLATEHEQHYRELEGRHRRAMDEQFLKYEAIASQMKERNLVAQQTQQRYVVLQQEYDTLQRLVGRLQSRETSEAATITELRQRSESMASTIRELQSTIERQSDATTKLASEKEELIAACQLYKDQLRVVSQQYSELTNSVHQQRERQLADEQQRLAAVARHDELVRLQHPFQQQHVGVQGGGAHHQTFTSADLTSPSGFLSKTYVARHGHRTPSHHGSASGEIAALRSLVGELQKESEKVDSARRQQERKHKKRERRLQQEQLAQQQSLVGPAVRYAEVHDATRLTGAYGTQSAPIGNRTAAVGQRSVSPLRVTGSVGEVLFGDDSPFRESHRKHDDNDSAHTLSPSMRVAAGGRPQFRSVVEIPHPYNNTDDVRDVHYNDGAERDEDMHNINDDGDDAVSLSTMSSHTAAVRRSHQNSLRNSREVAQSQHRPPPPATDVDVSFVSSDGAGEAYPHVSAASDSTSAATGLWDVDYRRGADRGGGGVRDSDDFVFTSTTSTSVRYPQESATATTTTTSGIPDIHAPGALPDISNFVQRLKENRDRLIETGVYSEEDELMRDMSKKIRVYEHYLKAHFQ